MKRTRAAGEKILAVLGPAVVHTGSVEHICQLIRDGYLNVLFAGNALATHDIEQALFGTSLGVSLDAACRPRRGTSTICGRSTPSAGSAAFARPSSAACSRAASCTSASGTTFPSCWPAASATMARCRR